MTKEIYLHMVSVEAMQHLSDNGKLPENVQITGIRVGNESDTIMLSIALDDGTYQCELEHPKEYIAIIRKLTGCPRQP